MYIKNYPNLELLDYKTRLVLLEQDKEKYKNVELQVEVFPQTWGSTALGFGGIGGQAMTTAYTTVFYDILNDVGVVYFDGRLAYFVNELTDNFMNDLMHRDMKSYQEAFARY